MATIAYILLGHAKAAPLIQQIEALTAAGGLVSVHFDRNSPRAEWRRLQVACADMPGVALVQRRARCGWGEWSLVAATLKAVRLAMARFPQATHFQLMSGDCAPVATAAEARARLDESGRDWIEHHDLLASDWIGTGLRAERIAYRHWWNERRRRGLFYASLAVQKALRLRRSPPAGLRVQIGSQWWVLRRETIARILSVCADRPEIVRFFRTVWIPDECFFQTMVAHLVPAAEIENRSPTFVRFTDYGLPVQFHDDQAELLLRERALFARKISPRAVRLRATLWDRFASDAAGHGGRRDAHAVLGYLAGRGRVGRRTPSAPWSKGPALSVLAVCCKSWPVAEDLVAGLPGDVLRLGYVFDGCGDGLPDLGGYEADGGFRQNHPAEFLRIAAEAAERGRVAVALDPSRTEILDRLAAGGADMRVAFLDAPLDAAFLRGHGARLGLWADRVETDVDRTVASCLASELQAERSALTARPGIAVLPVDGGAATAALAGSLGALLDSGSPVTRQLGSEGATSTG